MNKLSEQVRNMLEADDEKYRQKWQSWKIAEFASLLTINSFFIGIAPFLVDNDSPLENVYKAFLVGCCLASTICILGTIYIFTFLYSRLGFRNIPNTEEELDAESDYQRKTKERYEKWRSLPKLLNGIAITLFIISLIIIIMLNY